MKNNNITIIKPVEGRQVHRAGWVITDPSCVIENGYIEVENGVILDVHQGVPKEKCIDHGPGVLMPPLVNTHLHLELSALKNSLPFNRGFKAWVNTLLEKRAKLSQDELIKAADRSVNDLFNSGTLWIGDISTLGIAGPVLNGSVLYGISFHEFLGSDIPSTVFTQKRDSISSSLAGHAPHSSSPRLLKALKQQTIKSGLPFSIHVAESDDEQEFIHDKKGEWADFLTSRGIDWSSWDIGSKTPVEYVRQMGLLDRLTIVVHALNANDNDIDILKNSETKVCVCPRSNQNLHGKLPDIGKMIKKGLHPALGTDSLASCDSLSIFDEMAFVKKYYPGIAPEVIFSMATINGAKALSLEGLTGALLKGYKAPFLYKSLSTTNKKDLFNQIVSNE